LKKSLAYTAMAVVLGTALMLTPTWLFPAENRYGAAPDQYLSPLERLRVLHETTETLAGIKMNQPTDAISVSLMLTISLVFALGTFLYMKRGKFSRIAA